MFFAIALVMALFSATELTAQVKVQDVQGNANKFARMLRLIESYYVDTTNIESLTEEAIVHMLAKLDPHSMYISAEEVSKMNEPLEGSFDGIGISFNILHDTLMVVQTIPGGPSEKVGLAAGDRILTIDEENVAGVGLKNSDVVKKLRGEKGTKVKLEVKRGSQSQLLDFVIVRDKIPIFSMDVSYMLDNEIGYIKLNRFAKTTDEEINEAIKELKKNPQFKDLILDLRGNGGGFMSMAVELADQFLEPGKLVVYTDGVHNPRRDYKTSKSKQLEQGKLVVLIDESSASASEIVSGAVQDWDRGIVIGRRSYGKGLVQQPFPLTDGSIVRLTTSHYYTPTGRCIQKPYEGGVDAYRDDYENRLKHGELFNADSIQFDESQMFKTLNNGRKVYAGGGIMPDIFVPLDTSVNYTLYNKILRKNVLYDKIMTYQDKYRSKMEKKYQNFEAFNKSFTLEDNFIEDIIDQLKEDGIEAENEEQRVFAIKELSKLSKAIIARNLFESGTYYQVMNLDDEMIEKALSVLKDDKRYNEILKGK